jgi:glycosyltransferase involved in cell wall biosynthesis
MADNGNAPAAKRSPRRILVVTPFEEQDWKWLSGYFPEDRFAWDFINGRLFGKKQHAWAALAWQAAGRAHDFDLVVSHHPYMTLWMAAALRGRRVRTPHIAFSFNHGNKRFFTGPLLWLARRVLPDVSLFNVYSTGERQLFNRLYNIPLDKLRFSHWAVQPPLIKHPLPQELESFQPYVCAIGRNNRDFPTFREAVAGLPVNAVVVCSARDAQDLPPAPNLRVLSEISLDESMQVLAGSLISVVPLRDNSTGAGHMTFVHAMHLGIPQVATDVENTGDYFFHGVHGFRVPPQNPAALRDALARLLDDPALRERFGRNARDFAEQWLSEGAAARSAREVIEAWAEGQPWSLEPAGWPQYAANLEDPHSPAETTAQE